MSYNCGIFFKEKFQSFNQLKDEGFLKKPSL